MRPVLPMRFVLILLSAMLFAAMFASGAAASACAPPRDFVAVPPPQLSPDTPLAAHTEEIVIARPLADVVRTALAMSLAKTVQKTNGLPGVAGTYLLTHNFKTFGPPGSRQFDCLSDGSTLQEQSLAWEQTPSLFHFRYVVWNYTTEQARPIAYGLGEFRYSALDAHHTRIHWTYSFALRPDRFPGYLGALGRFIFEIGFLDRQYAELMKSVLEGVKKAAEQAS